MSTTKKITTFSGMADNAINAHGGKILVKGPNAERHKGGLKGIVMMIKFVILRLQEHFILVMNINLQR